MNPDPPVALRGFLLQMGYRVQAGRPVVTLHGKLEGGRPFLLRDSRQRPRFHILETDRDRAAQLGAVPCEERPRVHSMDDRSLIRIETSVPSDIPPLRDRLSAAGIDCFEADVRFAYRMLIDHGIRGALEIRGPEERLRDGRSLFVDPEIAPCHWRPTLSVLSLDIETDPTGRQLLSVALAGENSGEVLLWAPEHLRCPSGAIGFSTQRELMRGLVRRLRQLDPDILTGWNVIDFDLTVLQRFAERFDVPLQIGRGGESARVSAERGRAGRRDVHVPGRVVLDGIDLLRGAFVRMERYGLDAVAHAVLGRGKTMGGPNRADAILEAFRKDRPRFVEYNLTDARLVLEILDKLQLIELTVERCLLTGMPPDRVSASIASFDFLYLSELFRRGRAAPTVQSATTSIAETQGGHVLEPRPGLYRNVLVLDFRSLYPSVIRTFQIDPLGHRLADTDHDPIVAPNGARFRRSPGILPGLLDELFPKRAEARSAGNPVASQAIKILMNSFYGVLGTSACRFASAELANAITGFGKEILLWAKSAIERRGHDVLYGDTDSLFVLAGVDDPDQAERIGHRLVADVNRTLEAHVRRKWQVASKLELEFERLYLKLLLPMLRRGKAGARKRYAGLIREGASTRVVFTGMESVRRDWTVLAKELQRELYRRLFDDEGVELTLRQTVASLRAGERDGQLTYRKVLRKPLAEYTASTPPHVAAARKLGDRPPRIIEYVITGAGPEPVSCRTAPIDHEHYVQKQVRPVAEPVLAALGLDFDRIIGDDRQLTLF